MPGETLISERLLLEPITVELVEAIMEERRDRAADLLAAELPAKWPGRALIERAFSVSLPEIRSNPVKRLWGDRVMITREARRVVGSVVFHGFPDDGQVEIAYGVEEDSQRQGFATEAVLTSMRWALAQRGVRVVRATTPPWHAASRRVLEKVGMAYVAQELHDVFGEVLVYECADVEATSA